MKKIILISASALAFSSATFADLVENQFYIRGNVSGAYTSKMKSPLVNMEPYSSIKVKSKFSPEVALGVGYSILDNARIEAIVTHQFMGGLKGTLNTGKQLSLPAPGAPAPATGV